MVSQLVVSESRNVPRMAEHVAENHPTRRLADAAVLARRTVAKLPGPVMSALRKIKRRVEVRFGSFRRLTPIAANWGIDRGQPVDRHFIERFIDRHRSRVCGRVLEIQDTEYTVMFGSGV